MISFWRLAWACCAGFCGDVFVVGAAVVVAFAGMRVPVERFAAYGVATFVTGAGGAGGVKVGKAWAVY